MSGGFFRGTSADQDTRFSNKQLKLMKSQKFAPELEHLVDMTKVNMEVMKPWITRRVTELLGFEDEVLINFIHSLLDVKEVNGKEVQIQLTGFMEKNTGKFMKELWTLLLSAQKNASGVPQQFLDAKEEELRKKKVDNDRIANEIQRKKDKEGQEVMEERQKKLDGGFDAKDNGIALEPTLKPRDSGQYIQDGKESEKRNGVRGRSRVSRSPHSPAVSASPHRRSPSRSMSKLFSNSRSYSGGRYRSKSISRSPEALRRSLSSERIHRSPRRQSISRRHSPQLSPRRRPSYSRRRSRSLSNDRSVSPVRRRVYSPYRRSPPPFRRHRSPTHVKRRRSPSPVHRHRSPSPVCRRRSPSPVRRRRSPSPVRRRRSPSPVCRRRSPSPMRRRRSPSPVHRRRSPPVRRRRSPSPVHQRSSSSPVHRRSSPSPVHRRSSPSPVHRRSSPSPVHRRSSPSPVHQRRSPSLVHRHRSPSPMRRRRSPSPVRHRSPVMRHRSPSPTCKIAPARVRHSLGSPVQPPSPVSQRYGSQTPQQRSPSPFQRRSPVLGKKRSLSPSPKRSPDEWSSQSLVRRASPSPVKRISPRRQRSPVQTSRGQIRTPERFSPVARQFSRPLQYVQRDKDRKASHYKSQDSVFPSENSPHRSLSPQARSRTSSEDISPQKSPPRQSRGKLTNERSLSPPKKPKTQKPRYDSPEASDGAEETYYSRESRDPKSKSWQKKSNYLSPVAKQKDSPARFREDEDLPSEKAAGRLSSGSRHYDNTDESRKGREIKGDKYSGKGDEFSVRQKSPMYKKAFSSEKPRKSAVDTKIGDRRRKSDATQDLVGQVDHVNQSALDDSVSEESDKHRREGKDKRKHRKPEKKVVSSEEDYSSDSDLEDRKEAKRRKKEEKKLRKEEKRRRREERRRQREEWRAEKLKMKSKPDYISDYEEADRMDYHRSDNEGTPSDPKKLEIELRNKALESLKAKRGMNN